MHSIATIQKDYKFQNSQLLLSPCSITVTTYNIHVQAEKNTFNRSACVLQSTLNSTRNYFAPLQIIKISQSKDAHMYGCTTVCTCTCTCFSQYTHTHTPGCCKELTGTTSDWKTTQDACISSAHKHGEVLCIGIHWMTGETSACINPTHDHRYELEQLYNVQFLKG